jgi:hypothetical protein
MLRVGTRSGPPTQRLGADQRNKRPEVAIGGLPICAQPSFMGRLGIYLWAPLAKGPLSNKIGPAGCERRGRPGSRDQGYLLAVPGAGWTATVHEPNGKSGVSPDDVTFSTSHAKGRPRRAQERNDGADQDPRWRVPKRWSWAP